MLIPALFPLNSDRRILPAIGQMFQPGGGSGIALQVTL
jgi:hypothetical protein